MTNERALKNIENQVAEYGFNGTLYISCEEYGAIKSALEYRTPKKPLPEKLFGIGICPTCNAVFLDKNTNFCGNCGQALDWRITDECC